MLGTSPNLFALIHAIHGSVAPAAGAEGVLGWGGAGVPMLVALPVLLVMSGFFSGSETALFAMSESQRMSFRRDHPIAGAAVEALLSNQRMLLITVLLGNMLVNVLYFVITSVLIMRSSLGALGDTGLALLFLMLIILTGEVGPKVVANAMRVRFATLSAPPLLALHRLIAPVRILLNKLVVGPLSRLTAPPTAPPGLQDEDLRALLEVSSREGLIDDAERRILRDVLSIHRLKVRDVMTPRTRMQAVAETADRDDVFRAAVQSRLTKLPVRAADLDHIVGILHVKRYLLDADGDGTLRRAMSPPIFVPEMASLEQLLDHFRRTRTQSAIVVDEYGGTEGIVSIEDVVEEIVGDIVAADEEADEIPRPIGPGRWRVSGDASVHLCAETFGIRLDEPRVSTLSGLLVERLGRTPEPGDVIDLDRVRVEVRSVDGARIVSAIATTREADEEEDDA